MVNYNQIDNRSTCFEANSREVKASRGDSLRNEPCVFASNFALKCHSCEITRSAFGETVANWRARSLTWASSLQIWQVNWLVASPVLILQRGAVVGRENLSAEPHLVSKGASAGGTLSIWSTAPQCPCSIITVDCFVSSTRMDFCSQGGAIGPWLFLLVSFLQWQFVDSFNRNLNKLLNTSVKLHLNSLCQSEGLLGILLNGIRIHVPG